MTVLRRQLTVVDRTTIELRLMDGWGVRAMAAALDRSAEMISDEIARHSDAALGYRAGVAQAEVAARRRVPGRKPRLRVGGRLFGEVAGLLRLRWSPEQISGRRQRIEGGMELQSGLSVSHEAIDKAIYALPRGELRRESISCLRHEKPSRGRKPKGRERRGRIRVSRGCSLSNSNPPSKQFLSVKGLSR